MNNYIEDADNELLEFSGFTEIIQLEPEQSQEAWQITENIKVQKGKLQIYFQALALVAFAEWLQKRESNLSVDRKQISLLHPECAQAVNAVCNLQVGNFKVCLIPTTSFSDEWVDIPQIVIHSPEFANHFYVVVAVDDESEIAGIKGFATHGELVSMTAKIPVVPEDDIYELNLANFHQRAEELLLFLQCLPPTDIQLPIIPDKFQNYLQDLTKILHEKAVNTGLWMQNQRDELAHELAQELAWKSLEPSHSMRLRSTAAEDLESILTEIDDVEIPAVAARSYRNLELASTKLRLYAIIWYSPQTQGYWNLLLILGAIPGSKPPLGVELRISDLKKVLDEQKFDSDNNYLFTQIEGNIEEKFVATIISADRKDETSVVFEFRPE